jgi:hypothetical protein
MPEFAGWSRTLVMPWSFLVLRMLGQLPPAASLTPGLMQDVEDKIKALSDLINAVDKDHQKAGHYLLTKLNTPPPNSGTGSRGVAGFGRQAQLWYDAC